MHERRPPTHKLVIEIPLNVYATTTLNYDAVKQALELALAVSRAGVDHVICDDIQVMMTEVSPGDHHENPRGICTCPRGWGHVVADDCPVHNPKPAHTVSGVGKPSEGFSDIWREKRNV